jgi:hypothetical protein
MSALMADHRDPADDERQPSLFDVLAPPSGRPQDGGPEQPEGGRVVEFPRRRPADASAPSTADGAPQHAADGPTGLVTPAPADAATDLVAPVPVEAPAPETPTDLLERAPTVAPEDAWLTEIAPDLDEAEATMLAPRSALVDIEFAPEEVVAGEPRTQRAAGMPLSGPTLDDVVSRVWEGLVMRLPAACPVCHGEVLPAAPGRHGGSCTACGTTIE